MGIRYLGVAALAFLFGCASQDQVSSTVMEQATAPLTCMSKAECDAWWARAGLGDQSFRVPHPDDHQLGDPDGRPVQRQARARLSDHPDPTSEATATIGFAAHHDSPFGCDPSPWQAGADFKQFVRNGPPTSRYTTPQATAPAPSAVQVNPIPQPVPLNLESQPGQSNQPLTPQ